jgi:hypothetical protein
MPKKKAQEEIKIIGCLNWKQLRSFMIMQLLKCTDEAKFKTFLTSLALSIGTEKELKERRKMLGINCEVCKK